MIDHLKESKGLDVSSFTCGDVSLYNAWLPGNKNSVRLPRPIEEVYREISKAPIPAGRKYLKIDVFGSLESGDDFIMPPLKYYFA